MSAEPAQSLWYDQSTLYLGETQIQQATDADPLSALQSALKSAEADMGALTPTPRDVPFTAGFIGVFGYPLHQYLERQREAPADPTALPELLGGYYNWALVTDHYKRTTTLYSHRDEAATNDIKQLFGSRSRGGNPVLPISFSGALADFTPTSSDAHYRSSFRQIQDYIFAGDCYQTNLARHYQARIQADEGWALYKKLQRVQGSAFSGYLSHPKGSVLCLSPERLALRNPVQGMNKRSVVDRSNAYALVETCPIKGTAPRLADAAEDLKRAERLLASEKNRAENLMIVDLLRNDLGRIAEPGQVRVRRLFELVSLPNVHHLVSTVTAAVPASYSALDLLRVLLPGGSITGAPKIRAVDIINEVESVGRSAYCGSLGYIDHSGRMDMNIAIRTLVLDPSGDLHLWGGGAIVADSDIESEAREIDYKIGALLRAI